MPRTLRTILLSTLNSRYFHSSLALRYLLANLGELREQASIREFTIAQNPEVIAQAILEQKPKILGLGIYIWNAEQSLKLVRLLNQWAPDLILVLGGPEVSYESEDQEICHRSDYVIQGEGDLAFSQLCQKILNQDVSEKYIGAKVPPVEQLCSPYPYYTVEDICQRVIYVEASRGCPFRCEFCLSSLDQSVRNFPLNGFLRDMQDLLNRGARQFKFIDRTFNLNPKISTSILQFFLKNIDLGIFLHFEMIPDRFPEELMDLVAQFPKGSLQFEIGIQTFNEEVSNRISRRQDNAKVEKNINFLKQKTHVYIHADLIAGLPGEDEASFAQGFNRLLALNPQEIQVGRLKRLRGTPIIAHDKPWKMVYALEPPYEVHCTKTMNPETLERVMHFSKFWDRIFNRGDFPKTTQLMKDYCPKQSFYEFFMEMSEYLFAHFKRTHSMELIELTEKIYVFLTQNWALGNEKVFNALSEDYSCNGKRILPEFMFRKKSPKNYKIPRWGEHSIQAQNLNHVPKRQRKYWMNQL